MTTQTAFITYDNGKEIVDAVKKAFNKEMFTSYDALITYQNAMVAWLGLQVESLAEEKDTREARMAAKAVSALFGDLYSMDDESEEENARMEGLIKFTGKFMADCESAWLCLSLTVGIVRHVLGAGVYACSKMAEDGNTTAIKALSAHKANLAAFDDIALTLIEIAEG